MIDIRAGILAVTICALIAILDNQPKPVKPVETPYCMIDYEAAQKHPFTGQWVTGWVKGYGPCSLQDIYREI